VEQSEVGFLALCLKLGATHNKLEAKFQQALVSTSFIQIPIFCISKMAILRLFSIRNAATQKLLVMLAGVLEVWHFTAYIANRTDFFKLFDHPIGPPPSLEKKVYIALTSVTATSSHSNSQKNQDKGITNKSTLSV
jgi:hypothetical protein